MESESEVMILLKCLLSSGHKSMVMIGDAPIMRDLHVGIFRGSGAFSSTLLTA